MIYAHCQSSGCSFFQCEGVRSLLSVEMLKRAAAHVADTGHVVVKISGSSASVVKDQTLVLSREQK